MIEKINPDDFPLSEDVAVEVRVFGGRVPAIEHVFNALMTVILASEEHSEVLVAFDSLFINVLTTKDGKPHAAGAQLECTLALAVGKSTKDYLMRGITSYVSVKEVMKSAETEEVLKRLVGLVRDALTRRNREGGK